MAQETPVPVSIAETDIAIVGMAAHLPGAPDIDTYWQNLAAGVESIRTLSDDDLLAAGESPARLARPNYVRAAAILDGFKGFDADFWGFSPKEAAILDPQHRQFLEVAWEALENAAHTPERFAGAIGVWAGCGAGTYFWKNLCSNRDLVEQTGLFLLRHTGNDKDFLATRVSHILDLKGPSINVQTACSTSLVAVHYAAQALLAGECDMALAGGVTIELPHGRGYLFEEGEILSPDGHCHAFDHRAQGTVFGSGAGCVVLRRARDALRDGDHIWALIRGSAVNNDGSAKAGYLAPSVDGQAACIATAQAVAGVDAGSISYVECHGTGTYLGDPIEVAALTEAFRETTDAVGHCRIGSVKTNIGHLDTAAGVASLIKVALSLHHRQLPPSLGFEAPNPAIGFDSSPFRVNDCLRDWTAPSGVLRAGVNSLGVGGTNAHAVLEQAPARAASDESDWPFQPLVLSARSKGALDAQAARLAAHLRAHPEQPLADVAFTLKEGRRAFDRRRVLVAHDHGEAAALLEGADPRRVFDHDHLGDNPEVVFMFPGGGAQYAGMARDLYETEPVFADWMDRGLAILETLGDEGARARWLPGQGGEAAADEALKRPSLQLPLIMIAEYALAKLYESWGVRPSALVGHSMGENTAAALAGVMGFEDCIRLVHLRGRLFDTVPAGGMLSVPLDEGDLRPWLGEGIDLASVNAPGLCVVSGPDDALARLAARLAAEGVETQRIAIDIAAHSHMVEPILERFGAHLRGMALSAPRLPVISNRTGRALTAAEATDPAYWVAHLRHTVDFHACMATLSATPGRVYVEMGPGRALSSLARANGVPGGQVIAALRHPEQDMADDAWHLASIARLWACGVAVDWAPVWGGARRNRVPLPGYAFQRRDYFIEEDTARQEPLDDAPVRIDDIAGWGWKPHWSPAVSGAEIDDLETLPAATWLVLAGASPLSAAVVARLRAAGQRVITLRAGDRFARSGEWDYVLAAEHGREGYDRLMRDLVARGLAPSHVLHLWLAEARARVRPGASLLHHHLEQGFWSLLFLLQAMAGEGVAGPVKLVAVTTGAARVRDEGLSAPEKALILGPVSVAARELPGYALSALDVDGSESATTLAERIIEEGMAEGQGALAALRAGRRFEAGWRRAPLPETGIELPRGAHVLITGGLGGIGLTVAGDLIRRFDARVTLVSRRAPADGSALPAPLAGREANVLRVRADVTNLAEMEAARDAAVARFGPVHAVIHGAGAMNDGPLLSRTEPEAAAILAPKLQGTLVLDRLFPDGAIALMVLFSSTSTATGPAGQVDYVAANAFLNAYARSRAGGATRVVAIDWGMWQGVGMAARSLGAAESPPAVPLALPMLEEAGTDARGNDVFFARYTVDRWVFDGHRTRAGQALLPGTGYLELAAEAWRASGNSGGFELRDVTFLRALDLDEGETRGIRLRLVRDDAVAPGDGASLRLEVQSQVAVAARQGWLSHATARIGGLNGASTRLDVAAITARLPAPERGRGLATAQEAHLAFGPRWRVLESRAIGAGEGLAHLRLPDPFAGETQVDRPDGGWLLHPALLDIACGWAMELIEGYRPDHLWVPVSIGRIQVHRPLPAAIISHMRNAAPNRAGAATARFDVTLATPEGDVIAEFADFTLRRLEGGLVPVPPDPQMLEPDEDDARSSSPVDERLLATLRAGIRPEEGTDALLRALALDEPQMAVSSLDLPSLIRQTANDAARPARGDSAAFERPELDSDYVAPSNEIERRLAGFWQELLGIERIGVEDSFFDLGGHSLIAVRLFAMVKRAFRAEFPISVLFEAPTIAACARLIAEATGASGAGDTAQEESDAPPAAPAMARMQRRFTHVVPMTQGAGAGEGQTPFFMVAGMLGNVLNLRHMALLLGRPFYGLQARGLYGEDVPHDDFTEAARDYIAELRQVQPHGPYLLGGYSGGGLIAWEMAHQLEQAGEEVAQLVLLDTPLPMRPRIRRRDKALIKLAELRRKGPAYIAEWARNRWAWEVQKRRPRVEQADETTFHDVAIEAGFRAALPGYQMKTRAGATVLFRPPLDRFWKVTGGMHITREWEYVFPDNDLTRFAPKLEVIEVPGDHNSMVLEPNVRVLSARLAGLLMRAERTNGDERVVPIRREAPEAAAMAAE